MHKKKHFAQKKSINAFYLNSCMKQLTLFLLLLLGGMGLSLRANNEADKIIGVYSVQKDGRNSRVKIFKHNGGYRAQVIWLENMKNPDGSPRTDQKNPDPAKRNTPSNQIVLIDKVTYDGEKWTNGKIYDPTSGKVYNVDLYFDDDKVLTVKGKLGIFFKRVFWKKIQ